jgi:deazaflavin-dependent oxidoreductase (nitroreductase family)
MWYNPMMIWLLRSPLHGLISKSFMLVTYTGRKSGRVYAVPVNYVRNGSVLTVTSYRQRTWWRNLRDGAPVTVRLQGRELHATGEVIEDDDGVATALAEYLQSVPGSAKYFQVGLDSDGRPKAEDVVRAASGRVMVHIRLA